MYIKMDYLKKDIEETTNQLKTISENMEEIKQKMKMIKKQKSYETLLHGTNSSVPPIVRLEDVAEPMDVMDHSDMTQHNAVNEIYDHDKPWNKKTYLHLPTPIREDETYGEVEQFIQNSLYDFFFTTTPSKEPFQEKKERESKCKSKSTNNENNDNAPQTPKNKNNKTNDKPIETNTTSHFLDNHIKTYYQDKYPFFYKLFNMDDMPDYKSFSGMKQCVYWVLNKLYLFIFILDILFIEIFAFPHRILKMSFRYISKFICNIATNDPKITDDQKQEDANVITNLLYCILLYPLVIFISYNLYYIIAFFEGINEKGPEPKPGERPAVDEKRWKLSFDELSHESNSVFIKLLKFLFSAAITPAYYLDQVLLGDKWLPYYLKEYFVYDLTIPLNILKHFLLLIVTLYLVYSTDIVAVFSGNGSTGMVKYLLGFCTFIIVVFQLSRFYTEFEIDIFKISKWGHYISLISGGLGTVFWFFLYAGILTVFGTLSFNIALNICIIYILIHCIFGIMIYKQDITIARSIELIEKDFDEEIKQFYAGDYCVGASFFTIVFRNILKLIRCNKFLIVLSGLLIYMFSTQIYAMHSVILKWILFFIIALPCIFFIVFVLGILIYNISRTNVEDTADMTIYSIFYFIPSIVSFLFSLYNKFEFAFQIIGLILIGLIIISFLYLVVKFFV